MALEWQNIDELMERVRVLEQQIRLVAEAAGVPLGPPPEGPVESAIREGNVMRAVTLYQHQTGSSIAEAKVAVEAIQAKLGL